MKKRTKKKIYLKKTTHYHNSAKIQYKENGGIKIKIKQYYTVENTIIKS